MMDESTGIMKVRMTKEFAEQIFVRDGEGNKLSVEWGEPDADGFYNPTCLVDYEDNIIAQLKDEIETWKAENEDLTKAVKYAKSLCYKHSNGDDACHCRIYNVALGLCTETS